MSACCLIVHGLVYNGSHTGMEQYNTEFLYIELKAIVHSIERNVNGCLRLVNAVNEVNSGEPIVEQLNRANFGENIYKWCDCLRQFNDAFGGTVNSMNIGALSEFKKMFQMLHFAYAPAQLSEYCTDQKYNGFVSHIDLSLAQSLMIFIIDTRFPLELNLREEVIEWYDHIPMPGVVFGVDLGVDGIFRAVRDNVLSQNPYSASILFIDTGETVKGSALQECTFLKLSKRAQCLPAHAIPCKVAKILDADGTAMPLIAKALKSLLHESIEFGVVGIDEPLADMLLVHIRKKPPAFTPPQSSLNPFASQFQPVSQNDAMLAVAHAGPIESIHEANGSSVKNRVTAQKHDFSLEAYKIQNGEPNTSPSVASDADKLLNGDSSMSSSDGVPVLSAEEREQLFEEPRNISNVMKAVMGYDPKDNERICQFFNPETGKCFKGNNCRLEHVQIMKDGWTRDRAPTTTKISTVSYVPSANETVDIFPLTVVSAGEIYAYVPCPCECPAKMTPKKLKTLMNLPENRSKYKPIRAYPETHDLVLVKQKSDDQFYRARVDEGDGDDTQVLFLLDYGFAREFDLDCLYEWSVKWDYVPFLALRCLLVGVNLRLPNDKEANHELEKRISNKKIRAFVESSNPDEIYIRLTDENGLDVGQFLCEQNLAVTNICVKCEDASVPA